MPHFLPADKSLKMRVLVYKFIIFGSIPMSVNDDLFFILVHYF